ncbi:hypothetical protein CEXT_573141 [Caerostris extrusa]|uniref:Uncharacterized protein n=1 Tax=Caerostris extrusa TaxID=172846 RepID=A0AAV4XQA2_CAEEX|nr:hypothetical protein CEXT_573141 [Caerostris extrusa]
MGSEVLCINWSTKRKIQIYFLFYSCYDLLAAQQRCCVLNAIRVKILRNKCIYLDDSDKSHIFPEKEILEVVEGKQFLTKVFPEVVKHQEWSAITNEKGTNQFGKGR